MTVEIRCEPRRKGDRLDERLATRLNDLRVRREPEYRQSMRPVLLELVAWLLLATAAAVATVWWIV